jgi:outer membrane protein OmpA-like peptidoglycan-associated protein
MAPTLRATLVPLLSAALLLGALAVLPSRAFATEAETRQMIEALKPPAARSLRNLVVTPAEEAGAAGAAGAGPASPSAGASAPASAQAAPASAPPSLALAIQFEPNSSRVRPESGPLLGSLVAALLSPELKPHRFLIEGHADARGAAEHNLRLSQARADEVRLYLVALGVHPSRLRAVGRGTSQPADPRDPAAAVNRRVRVVTVE